MKLSNRLMIVFLVTLACAGCDQGTKSLATEFLPKNHMTSYFFDTVRIGYTENTGAFLGMGSQWSESLGFPVLTVLAAVMLVGLVLYTLYARINLLSCTGLALIFGGGASNLYDRVVNDGAVVDFLNLGFGVLRTGIFNIADVAIMLGGAILLYSQYRYPDSPERAEH